MTDTTIQPGPNTDRQGQPPAQPPAQPPVQPPPQPPVKQPAPPQPDLLQQAPPNGNEPNVIEYEPTGDVSLDIALGFFGKQGLGLDSPELAEAAKGNFSYLEAKFAGMGDKAPAGWKEHVNLAREAHGRMEAARKTEFEALEKSIHEVVGGPENWKTVTAFAHAQYGSDEVKFNQVKAAINGGGLGAVAMAAYLHAQALGSKSAGNIDGQRAVSTASIMASNGGLGAITDPAVFKAEQRALMDKHGFHNYDKTPEWQALLRRRAY